MVKRILFLAPYCIPINSPEAICNAKIIKVLADAGYCIDVISKNNNLAYSPDSQAGFFVQKVNSVRTFHLENKITFKTVIDHIKVFLKTGFVYRGAHWAYYAIVESEHLLASFKYDAVLSRSPASELAALYLSKKYGLRWIANWNDPYPDEKFPEPYGMGPNANLPFLRKMLIKQVALRASIHVFPAKRLKDYMAKYFRLNDSKTAVIPHVCIDVPDNTLHVVAKSDTLKIIHSGNVSSPRSPKFLFIALRRFLDRNPLAKVKVDFIGKQSDDFYKLVGECSLEKYINVLPPVDYLENLKLMSTYDVALLIEAPLEEGIFLPTKVGDYMQSKLPIWAISPRIGEMKDLFLDNDIEYFSDLNDAQHVYNSLKLVYSQFNLNGSLPRRSYPEKYSAASVLKKYDEIIC